jgi:serine/threonine protein kinase
VVEEVTKGNIPILEGFPMEDKIRKLLQDCWKTPSERSKLPCILKTLTALYVETLQKTFSKPLQVISPAALDQIPSPKILGRDGILETKYQNRPVTLKVYARTCKLHEELQKFAKIDSDRHVAAMKGLFVGHATYLVLESGDATLENRIFDKKTPSQLSWPIRQRIAHQVAKGLHYLHSQSLVHMNLNPREILISDLEKKEPQIQITAFGYKTSFLKETQHRDLTCRYEAPELSNHPTPAPTREMDVYSY